ncbi:hypothetical protein N9937_01020 [bacterium]|nr:hypothetical protein [bacterium]
MRKRRCELCNNWKKLPIGTETVKVGICQRRDLQITSLGGCKHWKERSKMYVLKPSIRENIIKEEITTICDRLGIGMTNSKARRELQESFAFVIDQTLDCAEKIHVTDQIKIGSD